MEKPSSEISAPLAEKVLVMKMSLFDKYVLRNLATITPLA
jgi:hypothetical protein